MTTEPIAPDPNAYGLVAFATVLVFDVMAANAGVALWQFIAITLAILCAFALFYATAHKKYKTAMELYALWKRAQPPAVMPDPYSIYHIRGTISMKTSQGWLDIGEGAGTFHITPPREGRPSITDPLRGHPAFREKRQTPPTLTG